MKKTYNIAWYARAGYLDLFPLVATKLNNNETSISSCYVCHQGLEEKHLRSVYKIGNPYVLARYLKENWNRFEYSEKRIKDLENKYDLIPLIRCIWSDMFELNLSEDFMVKNLIGHFDFWEKFLLENKIEILVSEMPSITSTCVAWLVCKKHNIEFISFINIPLPDDRIVSLSSWNGDFDGLEEALKNQKIIKSSYKYHKAIEYLEIIKNRPKKPPIVLLSMELTKRTSLVPINSIKRMLKNPKIWNLRGKINQEREYYSGAHNTLYYRLFFRFKRQTKMLFHKVINVFEKKIYPEKERYFLLPLPILRERSNYAWFGIEYADLISLVKKISNCLPFGRKLYVKEHPVYFGQKQLSFYSSIKKFRNIRLINPYEDTFKLIRYSEGIITLGSSVGFEALLMNKPVITLGKPWYRNFPGVYQADRAETLAEFLQNINKLKVSNENEKIQILSALIDISFKGVMMPSKNTLSPENIKKFAERLQQKIKKKKSRLSILNVRT